MTYAKMPRPLRGTCLHCEWGGQDQVGFPRAASEPSSVATFGSSGGKARAETTPTLLELHPIPGGKREHVAWTLLIRLDIWGRSQIYYARAQVESLAHRKIKPKASTL